VTKRWDRAVGAVRECLPDPVARVIDYARDEDVLMISAGLAFSPWSRWLRW